MLRDRMQAGANALVKRLFDVLAVTILVGLLGTFLIRTWPDGVVICLEAALVTWALVRCIRLLFERSSS